MELSINPLVEYRPIAIRRDKLNSQFIVTEISIFQPVGSAGKLCPLLEIAEPRPLISAIGGGAQGAIYLLY